MLTRPETVVQGLPKARARALAAGVLCAVLGVNVNVTAAATSEYEVKAAYLYNFASFASWPPRAFESASAPLRICTIGGNPFGSGLADILRNETVNNRALALVSNPAADELRRCHILFVERSTRGIDAILERVAGAPVLTIGEDQEFLRRGGILAFVIDNGRVRFDVNLGAAETGGLTLSARLLQVAREVHQ